jgi:hypothetical protein
MSQKAKNDILRTAFEPTLKKKKVVDGTSKKGSAEK